MNSWSPASRDLIDSYYRTEFPNRVGELPEHVSVSSFKEIGVALTNQYPVADKDRPPRDFIRRDIWDTDRSGGERTVPYFEGFDQENPSLLEFIQQPAEGDPLTNSQQLVDPSLTSESPPLSEAVYHSLDQWDRSQLIVIDIDAKDLAADRAIDAVGSQETKQDTLSEAGIIDAPPAGYPYTFTDIEQTLRDGFAIKDILEDKFNADDTLVVYSGQGCHVYLLDDDRHHQYDTSSRTVLTTLLTEKYGFTIDTQVTVDKSRLIRLPYSLHAGVSRVVQPIESPAFDFKTKAEPEVAPGVT